MKVLIFYIIISTIIGLYIGIKFADSNIHGVFKFTLGFVLGIPVTLLLSVLLMFTIPIALIWLIILIIVGCVKINKNKK